MNRPNVYLDYNATAPLLPEARAAMLDAMDNWGNPASVHGPGRKAKAIIQKARRQVAGLVNAKPEHVIFTSGATEAAATLLTPNFSMGRAQLTLERLYVCAADHPCTLAGGQFPKKAMCTYPVRENGCVDLVSLTESLKADPVASGKTMIVVHHANNETGIIQPIAEIAKIAKSHGAILVIDAVQSAGRINIDISDSYADYIILSSHKIGGPKGAGAIIAASDLVMPMPLISGGGQERGHRSGTESTVTIAGFGAAAQVATERLDDFKTLQSRRDELVNQLKTISSQIIVYGEDVDRVANTIYFGVNGRKAETLQIALDLAGYAASSGSACSSGKVGKSHVLEAMGVKNDDGAVRVSFGLDVSSDDLTKFANEIARILKN